MKQIKFTKTVKNKWLKALRSGKYKQGTQQLYTRSNRSYCCLGVLASQCGLLKSQTLIGTSATLYGWVIGLSRNHQHNLINKNDCARQNFLEIADYIEKNIPTV